MCFSLAFAAICIQAKQEEVIEKNLALLEATWDDASFLLTSSGQSDVKLLSISEEISELLEEHQMLVQNMMASKCVFLHSAGYLEPYVCVTASCGFIPHKSL